MTNIRKALNDLFVGARDAVWGASIAATAVVPGQEGQRYRTVNTEIAEEWYEAAKVFGEGYRRCERGEIGGADEALWSWLKARARAQGQNGMLEKSPLKNSSTETFWWLDANLKMSFFKGFVDGYYSGRGMFDEINNRLEGEGLSQEEAQWMMRRLKHEIRAFDNVLGRFRTWATNQNFGSVLEKGPRPREW
jgi:hypothetical protein